MRIQIHRRSIKHVSLFHLCSEIHPPPHFVRQKSRWIEGKPPLVKVSDVKVYTKSSRIALEYMRFKLIKRSVSTSGFRQRIPDFSSTVKVTKLKELCAALDQSYGE